MKTVYHSDHTTCQSLTSATSTSHRVVHMFPTTSVLNTFVLYTLPKLSGSTLPHADLYSMRMPMGVSRSMPSLKCHALAAGQALSGQLGATATPGGPQDPRLGFWAQHRCWLQPPLPDLGTFADSWSMRAAGICPTINVCPCTCMLIGMYPRMLSFLNQSVLMVYNVKGANMFAANPQ